MSATAGQPDRVHPLVTRVLAPNPSPYTFTGTQVHLVGSHTLAVIDPGPDDPAHLVALERAIAGRPVTAIVVTHHHRDHSPATRPLAAATGAPIIGAAPVSMPQADGAPDPSFDADYAPDRVLADGEAIHGDGWTLLALNTPGHTGNHLCFALPEAEALCSGDHVMGWSTSVVAPPDGDMGAYVASLERLQGRSERVYYPAHGEPIADPQRLLRGMIGHRRQREGQIVRLLGQGVDAIPEMTKRMYVGLDPRLIPGAERSVLAHLLDLEARGAAARRGSAWTAA